MCHAAHNKVLLIDILFRLRLFFRHFIPAKEKLLFLEGRVHLEWDL